MTNIFEVDRENDKITLGISSTSLNAPPLTASLLLSTDASKNFESVPNLASWIAGTSNRITVTDDGDGTITLSAPQDIHTEAIPTFAGIINGSSTIETTALYYGIYNNHVKIAGITDADDHLYGMINNITLNQAGGIVGHVFGLDNLIKQTLGDFGTAIANRNAFGIRSTLNLDAGVIYGDVYNEWFSADQEAAHEITGDAYGLYLKLVYDGTIGGTTYGIYVDALSRGLDYGIYIGEPVDNYFAGNVNTASVYKVDNVQVMKEQQTHITDAPGDTAANNAITINAILAMLEAHGLIANV